MMEIRAKHDDNYRYPGLRPFADTDHDRRLFFGRDEEIQYMLHSLLVENLFVLFAKSGMGKTSLLHAGLMDLLRQNDFLPLVIRFNDRDKAPLAAIYPGIENAIARRNETVEQKNKIDYESGETETLWQFFKTAAFWTSDDKRVAPVLIFDQFEEFFTLHPVEHREAFIEQLADLVRGRVPRALRQLYRSGQKPHFPYSEKPPQVKIIISMREDYLGYLDDLTREIPGILRNRFRLLPLRREKAGEAIVKPTRVRFWEGEAAGLREFSYTEGAVDEMLDFLCERRVSNKIIKTLEVEPFQLQLLCQHVEEKIVKRTDRGTQSGQYSVQAKDLGGRAGMRRILQGFYEERLRALSPAWNKRRARKLCEKGLIESESRVSLHKEYIKRKYKVPEALLDVLVNNRLLLRSEPRLGNILYELSHDTMVQPILRSRRERKIKNLKIGAPILAVILLAVFIAVSTQISEKQMIRTLYEEAEEYKALDRDREAIQKYQYILGITKKRAKPYLEIGRLHKKRGKDREAIKIYKEAIENKVKNEKIYYRLGEIYSKREKNPEKAIEYYEKAIEIDPKLSEAYRSLGIVYDWEQRFEEAEENYEKALEIDNKDGEAYKRLLVLYIRSDKYDDAIEVYRKAVKVSTVYKDIYTYIERSLRSWRGSHKLETFYQKAAEMDFVDASYYEKLGVDFSIQGKYDEAIENYNKALKRDETDASTYERLAVVHIIKEEPDQALRIYGRATKRIPEIAYAYRAIADALRRERLTEERKELYRLAADVDLDDSTYFEGLGDEFKSLKMYEEAITSYERAIRLDDKNGDAYKQLADLYTRRKEPGEALRVYRQAVEACVDCAGIYRDIGRSLKLGSMEEELVELYREAFEVNINEASYYEKLGDEFKFIRQYEAAVESYRQALARDNKRASTYRQLAVLHVGRDDPQEALRVYQDAVNTSVKCAYIFKYIAKELAKKEMKSALEKLYHIASGVNSGQSLYYKGIGDGFEEMKIYEMAVENYEKALAIDDRDISLYTKLARAYIDLEKIDYVIELFLKAVKISVNYTSTIMRTTARALREKGMKEELERFYRAASGLETREPAYYNELGTAYAYLEEYKRAIQCYEKVLAFGEKDAVTYKDLAILYIRLKKPAEAIRLYVEAVKVNVDYAQIIDDIAKELRKKKMKKQENELYQTAVKLKIKDPTYYKMIGNAFNKLKEYTRATATYDKVIQLAPQDHRAYEQRGVAYRKKGDYDNAVVDYQKAIKLNPGDASLYNKLAIAYGRKGDFPKAKENYEKTIKLDPGYIKAKVNLAEVELITENFDAAINLAKKTLWDKNLQPREKLPLMFISISALFFQGKRVDAVGELVELIKYYKNSLSRREYGPWPYDLSQTFIKESSQLKTDERELLLHLIKILESPGKVSNGALAEIEKRIEASFSR